MNDKTAAQPSVAKMAICSIIEAALLLFGLAQFGGTLVDILDGDSDLSVWICGLIGILCIAAIAPVFKWSIK